MRCGAPFAVEDAQTDASNLVHSHSIFCFFDFDNKLDGKSGGFEGATPKCRLVGCGWAFVFEKGFPEGVVLQLISVSTELLPTDLLVPVVVGCAF